MEKDNYNASLPREEAEWPSDAVWPFPDDNETAAPSPVLTPMSFSFEGTTRDYFRIWAVNTCLTMLTFGIFSAWAKVRKKRYFYAHTKLDGTPFLYLGTPIPILKGRILAAIFVVCWYLTQQHLSVFTFVVLGTALFLTPWIMVRSAAFTLRCTAYRNMTFRFLGSYGKAALVLFGWGFLSIITFGICFPWLRQRLQHFITTHTKFGGIRGEFNATGGGFFYVHFIAGLWTVLLILPGIVLMMAMSAATTIFGKASGMTTLIYISTVIIYIGYIGGYGVLQSMLLNLVWRSTSIGPITIEANFSPVKLAWIYFSNIVAIVVSMGLLIPWATVRLTKYKVSCISLWRDRELTVFKGDERSTVSAYGAEVGEMFDMEFSL